VAERKDQFLAMLAHELRNQLAAIDQALEIIRLRVPSDPAVTQATRVAGRQVALQTRLVDDLIDVSRIIRGQFELRREIVDLRAVVNAAAETLRAAGAARAQLLDVLVPPDPLPVDADPARLRQAIQNLLGNAVKFTAAGGSIRIVATREQDSAVVRVTDTGRGIEQALLSRVFDLYFQAPSARTDAQGGLGIGLTLVRRLVELQGGSVTARSDGRGRGSQFEILLPLVTRALPETAPAPPARAPSAVSRRVLVVEDNRDSRETLRMVLELQGHRVVEAADGETGVRLAVTEAPDVVLIDIGLPDIDGYEVAARIRRRLGAGIRLIAQSGYADDDARQRAEQAGFDAHLVKPVEVKRLSALLASA
jgi:CheY-like chemotaxis protein/two-component sensor histidine kinase